MVLKHLVRQVDGAGAAAAGSVRLDQRHTSIDVIRLSADYGLESPLDLLDLRQILFKGEVQQPIV